jgi:tricorn protease
MKYIELSDPFTSFRLSIHGNHPMKRAFVLLFALFLLPGVIAFGGIEGRFMKYPDISGNSIVFTYENDLWLVSVEGGIASRITNSPGMEYAAKFSPDGRWIAFTGTYDGPPSVYLIPSEGGIPARLTYVGGGVQTLGWTPDGERIVFRSSFEQAIGRDPNLYSISRNGSVPQAFPLDRGVLCSFSADGKSILYCRKGTEEYYWKRYKGGRYQDIWMYNFDTRQFTPISDYVGKNSYPMWIDNTMVFVSDRGNGIANLFAQDLGAKQIRPLTAFEDFDVMMPSTDRKRVVYMQDGYLNVLTVATGQTKRLQVSVPSDRWLTRDRTINPKDYIHHVDISNDGKTAVLEARGDVFVSPTGKGRTSNISNSPGTREMTPAISPDGKWVAFFSDRTGEYQLYTQKVEGGEWIPLTSTLDRTNYHPLWSPDGKKILFGNKDLALFVVDVGSKSITKIDESQQLKNDEFTWEISDYDWSPDSKWIVYTQVQFNRNNQVFLYSLEQKKRFTLTGDFFDNLHPKFDAAGEYLYYISTRSFDVAMDYTEDNYVLSSPHQIMVVQLKAGMAPPFSEQTGETKKSAGGGFRIDLDGIQQRTFPLPVPAGNYFNLKAGKGKVLWSATSNFTEDDHERIFVPGTETKWDLHIFDMESRKDITLGEKIMSVGVSANGEQLIIRRNADVSVTSLEKAYQSKNVGDKLTLTGMTYFIDTRKEWNQIFSDTWRWYRDFFYDPGMHGRDWKAMGEKYRAYIPWLSSREELNWVLSQMVGELCVSHTYIGGGDMGPGQNVASPVFTGWLGADLVPDAKSGRYMFATIYGPTEYNLSLTGPLIRPDIDVREGDYLLAINGTPVKVPEDYNRLLQITEGQKVTITVNRTAAEQGAMTYDVTPIRSSRSLRYFHWITDNINHVLKASDGKIGYMHITAMGSGGLGEFDKYWRAFRYKEGIIIDVRGNSGGWTEYFMIDKLERQLVAYNVLKNMVPFRYPGTASSAQYAALSNEYNGSDGEAFVEHFKARKLGTVIGTPSWGGLVGVVNGQTTIDNGNVQQSNNAFYGREGKWLVENHGADPDILLDNDPASAVAGKDLQLDKGIEVLLKKIKEQPFTFPPAPPYPKK